MGGRKRQCANCHYFTDAGLAGNGWCTHPKRQDSSDVKILVRKGELACRNSWGGDLFLSNQDGDRESFADESVSRTSVPPASAPVEDEVTSVTTPPHHTSPSTEEDRVVSDKPAPSPNPFRRTDGDDDGRNDAARNDQDERARVLARGSQAALRLARERHVHKRSDVRPDSSQAVDDSEAKHDDQPTETEQPRHSADHQTDSTRASSTQGTRFTVGHRYEKRRQRFDGAQPPVPRDEVEQHSSAATDADRFDTIPEPDPEFELPTPSAPVTARPIPQEAVDDEPFDEQLDAAETDDSDATPYNHVMERARRIREARRPAPVRRHYRPDVSHSTPHSSSSSNGRRDDSVAELNHVKASAAHYSPHYQDDDANIRDNVLANLDSAELDTKIIQDREFLNHQTYSSQHGRQSKTEAASRSRNGHHSTAVENRNLRPSALRERSGDGASQSLDPQTRSYRPRQDQLDGDDHPRFLEAGGPKYHDRSDARAVDVGDREHHGREISSSFTTEGGSVLPDLDENLFNETFDRASSPRRVSFEAVRDAGTPQAEFTTTERTNGEDLNAGRAVNSNAAHRNSPRDSLFRADHFRRLTRTDATNAEEFDRDEISSDYQNAPVDGETRAIESAQTDDLLDMTVEITPEVPRACRTCRSFRSADGGARGWCTNEWAFTHRRMVNEDGMPCNATAGCWWLPADRFWIGERDYALDAPTPRMNELIAQAEDRDKRNVYGA